MARLHPAPEVGALGDEIHDPCAFDAARGVELPARLVAHDVPAPE